VDSSIRGVASFEGDNLIVFNYFSALEIWPYKIGSLWWEGPVQLPRKKKYL
jgi:hypothetical protein